MITLDSLYIYFSSTKAYALRTRDPCDSFSHGLPELRTIVIVLLSAPIQPSYYLPRWYLLTQPSKTSKPVPYYLNRYYCRTHYCRKRNSITKKRPIIPCCLLRQTIALFPVHMNFENFPHLRSPPSCLPTSSRVYILWSLSLNLKCDHRRMISC